MGKINVAIIGVGNCSSSLVQGVYYYKKAKETEFVPGLMHVNLGGYHISDINFVAAFDIDKNKVGKELAEAIFTLPNNTFKFSEVPTIGVKVQRGMTHDGLGKYLSQIIQKAPGPTADIVKILKETKTDVVINYLPVGSEEATKWYIEQVLAAGCSFINCIPVFIAREKYWQERFAEHGLPIIGDDVKSQVGATISHRVLTRLFRDRGVRLERTYQLNFGGNTDFYNIRDRYLPKPSWVIPRWTMTPVAGTSQNLKVLLGEVKIASAKSLPTLFLSISKAATKLMSLMWYPPRLTCISPGTNPVSFAFL